MTPHIGRIRAVSGWGPRCGCGGESVLHLTTSRPVTTTTSRFYCAVCAWDALAAFDASCKPPRPPYWPGDEDRDESYRPPSHGEAA